MIAHAGGGTAVIIPFFQREPGLLAAAIRSALTQEAAGPITVVVCDDASPSPAELDLAMLTPLDRDQILLVRQANAGVGPARNAALEAMPRGIEWIAFLDSDDRWEPGHIARALAALRAGYDFCFADALREPQTRTHFQTTAIEANQHEPLGTMPGLFRFIGDFLTQNLQMSPVSISTVVMRASALGDLRFVTESFEDLQFWFEVARRPVRIAFDATLQVHYGHGDITQSEDWRSQHALRNGLLFHRIFMRISRDFDLTTEQRAIIEARMARNRQDFCMAALGRLRHGEAPAWRIAAAFMQLDLRLAKSLPRVVVAEMVRRLPFIRHARAA